jgi:single-strand DNA-binding protein
MVNKVILQGRLVADPELKYTQSDVANAEVTVAWSEKYKETETKCFLRCKAWRSNAEFINKYFRKGQEIVEEGHMVTEQWEQGGEKKSRTICLVDKVNFCGSKSDSGSGGNNQNVPKSEAYPDGFINVPDGIDEELPFN